MGGLATKIAANGGKTPEDPAPLIEFANGAAAKTVERKGAMSAIPRLDELEG